MNCDTCGLICPGMEIQSNISNTQYKNKYMLRALRASYVSKSNRPKYPVESKPDKKKANKNAAKAHKFLYVTIPAYAKRGICLDDMIKEKIISEYLKLRGLIIEIISPIDWKIYFPARDFKYITALPFNEQPKNRLYIHCVVCDVCRDKLMNYCIYCGDHKQKKSTSKDDAVAKRVLQLKWSRKCSLGSVKLIDMLSAVSLFKYSSSLFEK